MIMMHGTTSLFLESIKLRGLLCPDVSGHICEKRSKNKDKCYVTEDENLAKGYALRAVYKHGGEPVVLLVKGHVFYDRPRQWFMNDGELMSFGKVDYDTRNLVDEMVRAFTS